MYHRLPRFERSFKYTILMAKPSITIPKRSVEKDVLPNGTTFLYAPNPYNQIVAVRIVSRLASRHEPQLKAGMANLCMRLISSGTTTSTEEEIADRLEQHGAHFKAESGKDWSSISLLSTTENLREDLSVVMELLHSPTFPSEKLTRDRETVRMSIMEQEDSRLTFTLRRFRQEYFGSYPYAWPSIGLVDTLDAIKRDDLAEFAHNAFDPSQLVVSVVGGSEDRQVQSIIRDAFAQRVGRANLSIPDDVSSQSAISEKREFIEHRESEAEYIVIGYPGEGLQNSAAPALRIINAVLGGSMDSRLFREVRDKRGLCYQVGSAYNPQLDHSPVMAYVVTTPPNRNEAVQCCEAEFDTLKAEPVSEEELNRVKTYVTGGYVMSMESNMGQAARYATYETAGLGWDYTNKLPDELNAVTAEDIMKTAQRFFTHRLLTITAPKGE